MDNDVYESDQWGPWYGDYTVEDAVRETIKRMEVSYLASRQRQAVCTNCKTPISHCTCNDFGISKETREKHLGWV